MEDSAHSPEAPAELENGDYLWANFSAFLETIFSFCNQEQDLLSTFSSANREELVEQCLHNPTLTRSIERFTGTVFKQLNAHAKDDLEAARLRKDGNDLFKDKMYSDALETYSAAILKAKRIGLDEDRNDRNELCLSYANRSAAFFNLKNFKHALSDAERALSLGHYDKDKLSSRIQKCKLALEQLGEATAGRVPDEPFASLKISLDYDEQKGRKLIANKPIEMGEMLLGETAFASMLNSDYYLAFCNHCQEQLNGYGVPCDHCDYALFCSQRCLDEALKSYHKDECGKLSDLINQLGVGYLVLRLGFKIGFDKLIADDSLPDAHHHAKPHSSHSSDGPAKLTSNYSDVCALMSHAEEFEFKENLSFALVSLFFRQLLDGHSRYSFTGDRSVKLCKRLLQHIQQLSTNLISVDQEVTLDIYDNAGIEANEKLKVGVGFYPLVSLLNHSCVPNVMPAFRGNRLEIRAIKLIEQNQEILFCYGPSFYEDTKADRQKMLKDQYFFECHCAACESGEENKQRAYLCGQCNGAVVLNKDGSNFCLNCKLTDQSVNGKLLDEALMLVRIARAKVGSKKYEDALTDVNEAYTKLVDCVHRHHKELRACLAILVDCYSELGLYSVASQYSHVNFKLTKEIFGLQSVESLVVYTKICNLDYLDCDGDPDKREKLRRFVDSHLEEFESLEAAVGKKVDNFGGFDELKIVREIRSKV